MPYKDPEAAKANAHKRYVRDRDKRIAYAKAWQEKRQIVARAKKAAKKIAMQSDPAYIKKREEQLKARKDYKKQWYEENKCRTLAIQKAQYATNPKERYAKNRAWVVANRDKVRTAMRSWKAKNLERLAVLRKRSQPRNIARKQERYRTDTIYALKQKLRGCILSALRRKGARHRKTSRTIDLLGCTISELKTHIESLFLPGMTWQNHTHDGWHLDHIVPVASFSDLSDPIQQKACFNWRNLQPLWFADNIRKGARLDWKPLTLIERRKLPDVQRNEYQTEAE